MFEPIKNEPKIVLFDLETLPNLDEVLKVFPNLSNYPGLTLKAQINSIICFGYRVFGEKESKVISAWDFKSWNKNVNDDKQLLIKALDVLSDADAVVTHNGKQFDWKFLQTRLLANGLKPLSKTHHIDTKQLSKSNLYAFNNKLNTVAKLLNKIEKLKHDGWDLWVKVHSKNPKAMKLMENYCKQDVDVLNEVFKELRPFASNIPNYNLFGKHQKPLCPNCGSTRLESRGHRTTKTRRYKRYTCKDCGSCCTADLETNMMPR